MTQLVALCEHILFRIHDSQQKYVITTVMENPAYIANHICIYA